MTFSQWEETRPYADDETFEFIPIMPVQWETKYIILCLRHEVKWSLRPAFLIEYS